MPVEPAVARLLPDTNVRYDVEALWASRLEAPEITCVVAEIDDGVFIAPAGSCLYDLVVDVRVIGRVYVTGTVRQQKNIVLEYQLAPGATVLSPLEQFVMPHPVGSSGAHRFPIGTVLRLEGDETI